MKKILTALALSISLIQPAMAQRITSPALTVPAQTDDGWKDLPPAEREVWAKMTPEEREYWSTEGGDEVGEISEEETKRIEVSQKQSNALAFKLKEGTCNFLVRRGNPGDFTTNNSQCTSVNVRFLYDSILPEKKGDKNKYADIVESSPFVFEIESPIRPLRINGVLAKNGDINVTSVESNGSMFPANGTCDYSDMKVECQVSSGDLMFDLKMNAANFEELKPE